MCTLNGSLQSNFGLVVVVVVVVFSIFFAIHLLFSASKTTAFPIEACEAIQGFDSISEERIRAAGFGGHLKIGSKTLPAGFADWLMCDCYDADTSELVFPGRGRVTVNADSSGLPNNGDEVNYELDVGAINFIHEEYGIDEGTHLSIDSILERLKKNRTSNDDFLRSWLKIEISTFLCPPTGLAISPRCYPAIVDLSKVKELNRCQFVVGQLKGATSKMGKRKSFKGCLLVLVILYVDSLVVDDIQIPSTMPRVASWSKKLLDQEVIKLDTNHDGSFGKLKLKGSSYSTPYLSLFHMDDIRRFVSSKVPSGISDQKKQTLNTTVIQFYSGFTELLGTFFEQVFEREAPASQHVGSSKRPRENYSEGEPSSAARHNRPKRSKLEQAIPSCAQRQTRAMSRRTHVAEDESLCEEYEEDLLSDDNGEGDTDQDQEDEDSENSEDEDSDLAHESAFDDDDNGNLSPVLEDHFEDEDKGIEKQDEDDSASFEEHKLDATRADKQCNVQPLAGSSTRVEAQVDDSEDLVPLQVCFERLQASKVEEKNNDTSTSSEPQPLDIVPPEPTVKPISNAQIMSEKLRLPLHGDSHVTTSCPLDFTPPQIDIMKFVDSQAGPNNFAGAPSTYLFEVQTTPTSGGSEWSLSEILEEVFAKMENDAIIEIEMRKVQSAVVFEACDPVPPPSTSKELASGNCHPSTSKEPSSSVPPPSTSKEPASGNSSVTPAYFPYPRRIQKRPTAF